MTRTDFIKGKFVGLLASVRGSLTTPDVTNLAKSLPAVIRDRLPVLVGAPSRGREETSSSAGGMGIGGKIFLLFVLLPTFIFWLYALLWESKGYMVESRLTVRAAQEQKAAVGSDAMSVLSKIGGGSKSTAQDTYIVLNYLKSRALISDIGGRAYFEKIFARDDVDYFSRLKRGANLEELWKYWNTHLLASVDALSGILTIQVEAYNPQDALRLAKDLVRLSEALVNQITVRVSQDALTRADAEVSVSSQRLADAREKLLQFRNANSLIDPASKASSIGELIGKLLLEKIDIENSLATFSGSLQSDSPSQRVQRAKLAALEREIADARSKLTNDKLSDAVSAQIASYERLKLEEQFAQTLYTIAQNSYQKARQQLEKQGLYLVVVVAPTLPESETTPKVIVSSLLLFSGLSVLWGVGMLIGAAVADQMV
jgi:capsular polysaccharide transport system permease protein